MTKINAVSDDSHEKYDKPSKTLTENSLWSNENHFES